LAEKNLVAALAHVAPATLISTVKPFSSTADISICRLLLHATHVTHVN
jgi:hypothetical protein